MRDSAVGGSAGFNLEAKGLHDVQQQTNVGESGLYSREASFEAIHTCCREDGGGVGSVANEDSG